MFLWKMKAMMMFDKWDDVALSYIIVLPSVLTPICFDAHLF